VLEDKKERFGRNEWVRGSWTWILKAPDPSRDCVGTCFFHSHLSFFSFWSSISQWSGEIENNTEGGMVFFAWKVIKHKRTRVKPRTKGLWLWALRMSTNWSPQNTSLGSKQESKEWQKQLPKEKKSQIDWLLLSGIVRYWQKKIRQVTESLEARKQGIHIKLKGNSTTGSCTDYESFITTDWEAHSNLLTQIKSKCFSTFHASSPACGFTLRFHIVVREPSAAPKLQYLGLKFNWKEYFLSSLDDNNSHRSYSVTDTGHFFLYVNSSDLHINPILY
jgi:hypothetical protein